jgi:hypothetical protein
MKPLRRAVPIALALALCLARPLLAAEPERLDSKGFDVQASGSQVKVTFTLAMSDAGTYPVLIVATRGSVEEKLWEGSLPDGVYRLTASLSQISGSGPLTVVLRTKIVNRATGLSFTPYLRWEGAN